MKRTVVFFLIAACAVLALSLAEGEKKSQPATEVPAEQFNPTVKPTPPKTTTAKPTPPKPTPPKTTTAKPTPPKTTTAKPTPPKTTPPKTTAPKPTPPKTTTTKPTPPKPTTHNTTTTKPTPPKTTTPKPTSPAPKPTPSTNLTVGNYTVRKGDKICVMALMAVQIQLATPKANGTFIVQPNLTTPAGDCNDTTANLTLSFKEGFITFIFNKSAANNTVYVDALSFKISYPFSKGGNGDITAKNESVHLFAAKVGHSYSCKNELLYMGNGLHLDISQDRMQAFNLTKGNEFGSPDPCPADQPDYRVAIAVGVTLLVLIVIVVVVYLLSRRKRTDGYQSL